jgi:hypothetical protein
MRNRQQPCSPVLSKPAAAVVIMAATIVMMFGLASQTGAAALDNSWTTGGYGKNGSSQTVRIAALTNFGSFRADKVKQSDPTHWINFDQSPGPTSRVTSKLASPPSRCRRALRVVAGHAWLPS